MAESQDLLATEMFDRQSVLIGPVFESDDAKEGARAFAERRAPNWSDADAGPPRAAALSRASTGSKCNEVGARPMGPSPNILGAGRDEPRTDGDRRCVHSTTAIQSGHADRGPDVHTLVTGAACTGQRQASRRVVHSVRRERSTSSMRSDEPWNAIEPQ